MITKKLNLQELKVQSFITELSNVKENTILGGATTVIRETDNCSQLECSSEPVQDCIPNTTYITIVGRGRTGNQPRPSD